MFNLAAQETGGFFKKFNPNAFDVFDLDLKVTDVGHDCRTTHFRPISDQV